MKFVTLILLIVGWLPLAALAQDHPPYVHQVPLAPDDSPASIVNKAANLVLSPAQLSYHLDEFTAFVHFGPNTFSGVEWGNGQENPAIFDPGETLDTDQWCRIFKAAEIKKVIITVKHHDGFCTWQTRYNETFSVRATPWRDGNGDVLRELSESCQKHGLKLGIYLSPADLYQIESTDGYYGNGSRYQTTMIPTDPDSFKADPTQVRAQRPADSPTFEIEADDYNRYFMNQLYEVLTEYGPIHEVWFDGAHPKRKGDQQYLKSEWFHMVRQLAPAAVIFGGPDVRWCGNEAGNTRESEWSPLPVQDLQSSGEDRPADDIGSDEMLTAATYDVYGKTYHPKFLYYLISEVDVSIRNGWFWRNDDEQTVRTPDDVFDMYERAVGGNCGFLLNVPPSDRGLISPRDEACLMEVGHRIRATYDKNLASHATLVSKSESATEDFSEKLTDDDLTTYWQPDSDNGLLTVTLPASQFINRVVLQEAISTVGQRIKSHELDAWIEGEWKTIATATTIGYKKILRFPTVETSQFRVRVLDSRQSPTIAEFKAHFSEPTSPLKD